MVITEPDCSFPDFNNDPWDNTVLVMPRHGVWSPWNQATLEMHCAKTGNALYTFDAKDTVGKEHNLLTIGERVMVAGMQEKKKQYTYPIILQ